MTLITSDKTLELLGQIRSSDSLARYDYQKHQIVVSEGNEDLYALRLPIFFAPPEKLVIPDTEVNYVIALIQTGHCALGYYEGEHNYDHKVFKAYATRKKQGKSQLKHLKTKGKSRAGSRVRLASTFVFFEEVNERLTEYFELYEINRIALSCPVSLIHHMQTAKIPSPFDKKDERIYKIPKHVHTPKFEVLNEIHDYLCQGEVIAKKMESQKLDQLFVLT